MKDRGPKLTAIIEQLRDEFAASIDMDMHPEFTDPVAAINNGLCADFACAVQEQARKFGIMVRIVADSDLGDYEYSHSFMVWYNTYFDAECPEGTDDWKQLPCYLRPCIWMDRRGIKHFENGPFPILC